MEKRDFHVEVFKKQLRWIVFFEEESDRCEYYITSYVNVVIARDF